jgi:hypothetical protein
VRCVPMPSCLLVEKCGGLGGARRSESSEMLELIAGGVLLGCPPLFFDVSNNSIRPLARSCGMEAGMCQWSVMSSRWQDSRADSI